MMSGGPDRVQQHASSSMDLMPAKASQVHAVGSIACFSDGPLQESPMCCEDKRPDDVIAPMGVRGGGGGGGDVGHQAS